MRMPTVPVTRRQFVSALAAGAVAAALPRARAADAQYATQSRHRLQSAGSRRKSRTSPTTNRIVNNA